VKKFNTSKSSKYFLEGLCRSLKYSKETLIAALFDRVDSSVCSTPIPSTIGIEKHIESMYLAFKTENYMQALQIGKEILRKVPHDDHRTKAGIHYDMACTYSKLFNTPTVVTHLQSARAFGYSDFKQLDEDHDFDNVRFQLEFMNFRQMMEYEVLQTDQWREMNQAVVFKLTALFDKYDEEGVGSLSFTQFQALCKGAFGITSLAQVVAFWRETCEDTIEAMHLIEFLNFIAEHKDINGLLTRALANLQTKSMNNYRGYSPIHTSSFLLPHQEGRDSGEVLPPHPIHSTQFLPFSFSVEGQSCGWMGGVPRTQTVADTCQQQSFASQNPSCVSAPFSYYTTTDPLAKFRC